jgi:hypothetical protein
MPRTIDHILDCHHAATALRSAGKPVWVASLTFEGIVPDGCEAMPAELSDDQAANLGAKYAAYLRAHPHTKAMLASGDDLDLDDVVGSLESIGPIEEQGLSGQDDLNDVLDSLYDWADRARVWVTLR